MNTQGTEAAGVFEQQRSAIIECEPGAGWGGSKMTVGDHVQIAGHPQVNPDGEPAVEFDQDILSAPGDTLDDASGGERFYFGGILRARDPAPFDAGRGDGGA